MRRLLRCVFDGLVACVPASLVRGLLKTFALRPDFSLRAGFRVYPQTFFSPIVDSREIDRLKLNAKRDLPGIRIDRAVVESTVKQISSAAGELDCLPRTPGTRNVTWSETYPTPDSAFLYCLLRHLKPRRYVEVGCGFSSCVSSKALRRNKAEGFDCKTIYIEPYPGERLQGFELFGDLWVKRIEEVPVDFFQQLEAGDVLFIDTSHVIKTQNDVEYELLHILPTLKPGVYVHIHDIFTPFDLPEEWVIGPRSYWGVVNEQYALECLLSCTDKFEIILPLHLMQRENPELIERIVPGATDRAQAFWIRVTGAKAV